MLKKLGNFVKALKEQTLEDMKKAEENRIKAIEKNVNEMIEHRRDNMI